MSRHALCVSQRVQWLDVFAQSPRISMLLLQVLLTKHKLTEANYAALQRDLASCQGELAARCDDLEVLRDAHAAAEAQVTQQSQDIQVSPTPCHDCQR